MQTNLKLVAPSLEKNSPHPIGLKELRVQARSVFQKLSLPTIKEEGWRFTDLSLLKMIAFEPKQIEVIFSLQDIKEFILPEVRDSRIVFVNGVFSAELSQCHQLEGVKWSRLSDIQSEAEDIQLGQQVNFHRNIFTAANSAFFQDGIAVIIPKDKVLAAPIHVLFIAAHQEGLAHHPRCWIVAEAGSQSCVIEDYISLAGDEQFHRGLTNAVTEITLEEDSRLSHVRLQRESANSLYIGHCAVAGGQRSHYQSYVFTSGARLSSLQFSWQQQGLDAQCSMDGVAFISDRQHAALYSVIDHALPQGRSQQLYKSIVDKGAHSAFHGRIVVNQGANATQALQSSRNLLLSDKAHIDTQPQLEILADEVKCNHGATVGQLDNEALFYLKSRGLDEQAARSLLVYAFVAEVIGKIPVDSVSHQLKETVLASTEIRMEIGTL